jgi:hypothetical protein
MFAPRSPDAPERFRRFVHGDQLLSWARHGPGGAMIAQQQTFIVSLIIFLLSNPGSALGLDGLIFRGGKGTR